MKWFQVDSDMPNDPKIRAVARALGAAGIGGLTCIWCHVARHGRDPGRGVNYRGQVLSLEELREASLLPADDFRLLVELCVSLGHFDRAAWEQSKEIVIPAMARRADEWTKKRLRGQQQHLAFND